MTPLRRFVLVLYAILAIAAAIWLRVTGTLDEPLWLDEAYSAYAAGKGFAFLWHVVPLYETHPPFYYSLLRLWTLAFGDTLGALRALGILCGVLTLPVAALAAREAARMARLPVVPAMTAALLLTAVSPALVEMSREVRPYPVLILAYATALFALLRTGRFAAAHGRIAALPFALYILCLATILWLHNLGPLYAAGLGLAALALIARRELGGRDWVLFFGGHAFAALVYLPGLLILLDQAPTWVKSTWLHFSFDDMVPRLAELFAAQGWAAMAAGVLLLVLAISTLARSGEGRRVGAALLITAILPVVASITLSILIAPVFIVRTMTAVAVSALLLLAIGAAVPMAGRGTPRWAGIAFLLLLASQMVLIDRYRRQGGPMQDWYNAVRWLQERYRPGDVVWAYPNEGALPFDYAVRDLGLPMVSRPIPTAVPTLDGGPGTWYPTGSRGVVSLSPERLEALVAAPGAQRVPTIWLLRLGANAYDKDDHLLYALEAGRVRVADCESYPIDIIGLARPDVGARPIAPMEERPRCLPGRQDTRPSGVSGRRGVRAGADARH